MKLIELKINEKIKQALTSIGYTEATVVQEKTIPHVFSGKDVVVRSQTGSGKTLAFGLPLINNIDVAQNQVQVLVICPTRELAGQVADELRKATVFMPEIKITAIFGGADMKKQILALNQGAKIVVGTPGRIMDLINRRKLKLNAIKTLVLDEADEMLNMGFKEDIESILKSTPKMRQTLMFSATFPPAIKAITKNYQTDPVMIEVGENNQSLKNIKQSYVYSGKAGKTADLLKLLSDVKPNISIVFCNTKNMTEQVRDALLENWHNAVALHGDMRQRERTKVMQEMKKQSNIILVATDVAARGIDIKNVDYIFNYDIPYNVEYFLHRIGRTARAGKFGNAVTFVNTKSQLTLLKDYEKQTKSNIVEIGNNTPKIEVNEKTFKGESRNNRTKQFSGKTSDRGNYKKTNANSEQKFERNKQTGNKFDSRTSRPDNRTSNRSDNRPSNRSDDRANGRPNSQTSKRTDNRSDSRVENQSGNRLGKKFSGKTGGRSDNFKKDFKRK